ncbi:MAG TPA: SurA N-terminal domain-containing protein, partial [Thermoanaerobaculia bacterium]|nr:SurA N-terminal domain-containing protein [Thermoanaerobaculia bacterium]
MLKVLRENVKYLSWILWVIIALFVLFIFADFGAGLGGTRDTVSWAAKVGSATITRADYQHAYQLIDNQYRQQYGERYTTEVAKQLQVWKRALDQAIADKVLEREAERIGLKVSDVEVQDAVLEQFHDEQGRFVGQEQYTQALQRYGYTVPSFEDAIRKDLLIKKLASALQADLYVSDAEV